MSTSRFTLLSTTLLAVALAGCAASHNPPPAGMSQAEADMQACMAAGTPGPMHKDMARHAGTWRGRNQMWMSPDAPQPMSSECTSTITSIMDGRYLQCEMTGDIPGMGQFRGLGYSGYDNVSGRFVGSWLDNMSTGIMHGTGDLSKDGKTMHWTYHYNCPVTKKPTKMRQVETYPDNNTMTFEMFATDPHSGKEYKCMRIDFTRVK